ncbi:hypothetical protein C8Q75DRAFT_380359 [Abortiporus biennis]|nr:hypothetical protein C8Q75DRAFT_380359 [Abortiporus biennis]
MLLVPLFFLARIGMHHLYSFVFIFHYYGFSHLLLFFRLYSLLLVLSCLAAPVSLFFSLTVSPISHHLSPSPPIRPAQPTNHVPPYTYDPYSTNFTCTTANPRDPLLSSLIQHNSTTTQT